MNNVFPIQQFAEVLARRTGYSEEFCREFVMQLFRTVAEGLRESTRVRIKGLGEFIANEAHDDVIFIPDPELAATVNEPFSMFEPEELDADWEPEDVKNVTSEVAPAPAVTAEPEISIEPEIVTAPETPSEIASDIAPASEPETEIDTDEVTEVEVVNETETHTEIVAESETEINSEIEPDAKSKNADESDADLNAEANHEPKVVVKVIREEAPLFSWIPFLCGLAVGLIIGALAVYFMIEPKSTTGTNDEDIMELIEESTEAIIAVDSIVAKTPQVAETDTIVTSSTEVETNKSSNAETQPVKDESAKQAVVVTDIITTTLADLSRKHFNDYRFWVYIYEENKHKFANPDRVERGVEVVIPSKDKYDIDPSDPASLRRAEDLARQIYAR